MPGVTSAGYISFLPMVMRGGIWAVKVPGFAETPGGQNISLRFITPGFFQSMGIPVMAGEDVSERDDDKAPMVAIVSESFAKRYWPGQNPIGKKFFVSFFDREVKGVVSDIKVRGLERRSEPQVYLPYRQIPDGWMPFYAPKDLVIRSENAAALGPMVREIIRRADPELPVSDIRLLEDIVAADTADPSRPVVGARRACRARFPAGGGRYPWSPFLFGCEPDSRGRHTPRSRRGAAPDRLDVCRTGAAAWGRRCARGGAARLVGGAAARGAAGRGGTGGSSGRGRRGGSGVRDDGGRRDPAGGSGGSGGSGVGDSGRLATSCGSARLQAAERWKLFTAVSSSGWTSKTVNRRVIWMMSRASCWTFTSFNCPPAAITLVWD